MSTTSAPATLLFDLDGTLTDNFDGIGRSIQHALAALGDPPASNAQLRSCVGPPLRESFAKLLDTADTARVEAAIRHYRERYAELGWRENVAYVGIDKALAALRARGHRLLLCTSKPQVFAERIVAHFGFDQQLDAIYGADLAGAFDDKKDLLAHLLASETLDPAACVMIGDRGHDMRAAGVNRVRGLGVLWGYGSREELLDAGAGALIAAPAELIGIAL